ISGKPQLAGSVDHAAVRDDQIEFIHRFFFATGGKIEEKQEAQKPSQHSHLQLPSPQCWRAAWGGGGLRRQVRLSPPPHPAEVFGIRNEVTTACTIPLTSNSSSPGGGERVKHPPCTRGDWRGVPLAVTG